MAPRLGSGMDRRVPSVQQMLQKNASYLNSGGPLCSNKSNNATNPSGLYVGSYGQIVINGRLLSISTPCYSCFAAKAIVRMNSPSDVVLPLPGSAGLPSGFVGALRKGGVAAVIQLLASAVFDTGNIPACEICGTVYRVFGGVSQLYGRSWSPVDPRKNWAAIS